MKTFHLPLWLLAFAQASALFATDMTLPPGLPAAVRDNSEASPLRSWFIPPTRVVWASGQGVRHAENLLLVFHQPNIDPDDRKPERAQIFRIKEAGNKLVMDGRWTAKADARSGN